MVLTIQYVTSQEINVDTYSNEILGKWSLLNIEETGDNYVETDSGYYYIFKTNNILEVYKNSTLFDTNTYNIEYETVINNGGSQKFAELIINDTDFDVPFRYSLYILYDSDSVKRIGLEAVGTAKSSVYKQVRDN